MASSGQDNRVHVVLSGGTNTIFARDELASGHLGLVVAQAVAGVSTLRDMAIEKMTAVLDDKPINLG